MVEDFNGRVVGRSNNNANANGGVVYANANNASSRSNTNNGSRLANRKTKEKILLQKSRLLQSLRDSISSVREIRATAEAAKVVKLKKERGRQRLVGITLEHVRPGKLKAYKNEKRRIYCRRNHRVAKP